MTTIPLTLDDELERALETASIEQGRDKSELLIEAVRTYLDGVRLKHDLQDPALRKLYEEMMPEDLALAGQGMAEYNESLNKNDCP